MINNTIYFYNIKSNIIFLFYEKKLQILKKYTHRSLHFFPSHPQRDMDETRASGSDHNANNQPSGSTDCNSFILENVMLRCILPLRFIVCNLGTL